MITFDSFVRDCQVQYSADPSDFEGPLKKYICKKKSSLKQKKKKNKINKNKQT